MAEVVVRRLMQRAAIVPHDHVALPPLVAVDELVLGGMLAKTLQQVPAFVVGHSVDPRGKALVDENGLLARHRMGAGDRVKNIGPLGQFFFRLNRSDAGVHHGFVAGAIGMHGLEALDLLLGGIVEGVVGARHVRVKRIPALGRGDDAVKDRPHRRGFFLGNIRMPVGPAVVDRLGTAPAPVRKNQELGVIRMKKFLHRVAAEFAETAAVGQLPFRAQLLVTDDEDGVGHPGIEEAFDGLLVQVLVQIQSHDFRGERIVEFFDWNLNGFECLIE